MCGSRFGRNVGHCVRREAVIGYDVASSTLRCSYRQSKSLTPPVTGLGAGPQLPCPPVNLSNVVEPHSHTPGGTPAAAPLAATDPAPATTPHGVPTVPEFGDRAPECHSAAWRAASVVIPGLYGVRPDGGPVGVDVAAPV